jgi:hypothetical protein
VAEGRRSAVGHVARRAGQAAGAAQVDAGRGAEEEPADGRADRRADRKARHIFMSPGPIFEIDTDEPDYFRGARAMYAGGFRPATWSTTPSPIT